MCCQSMVAFSKYPNTEVCSLEIPKRRMAGEIARLKFRINKRVG